MSERGDLAQLVARQFPEITYARGGQLAPRHADEFASRRRGVQAQYSDDPGTDPHTPGRAGTGIRTRATTGSPSDPPAPGKEAVVSRMPK